MRNLDGAIALCPGCPQRGEHVGVLESFANEDELVISVDEKEVKLFLADKDGFTTESVTVDRQETVRQYQEVFGEDNFRDVLKQDCDELERTIVRRVAACNAGTISVANACPAFNQKIVQLKLTPTVEGE